MPAEQTPQSGPIEPGAPQPAELPGDDFDAGALATTAAEWASLDPDNAAPEATPAGEDVVVSTDAEAGVTAPSPAQTDPSVATPATVAQLSRIQSGKSQEKKPSRTARGARGGRNQRASSSNVTHLPPPPVSPEDFRVGIKPARPHEKDAHAASVAITDGRGKQLGRIERAEGVAVNPVSTYGDVFVPGAKTRYDADGNPFYDLGDKSIFDIMPTSADDARQRAKIAQGQIARIDKLTREGSRSGLSSQAAIDRIRDIAERGEDAWRLTPTEKRLIAIYEGKLSADDKLATAVSRTQRLRLMRTLLHQEPSDIVLQVPTLGEKGVFRQVRLDRLDDKIQHEIVERLIAQARNLDDELGGSTRNNERLRTSAGYAEHNSDHLTEDRIFDEARGLYAVFDGTLGRDIDGIRAEAGSAASTAARQAIDGYFAQQSQPTSVPEALDQMREAFASARQNVAADHYQGQTTATVARVVTINGEPFLITGSAGGSRVLVYRDGQVRTPGTGHMHNSNLYVYDSKGSASNDYDTSMLGDDATHTRDMFTSIKLRAGDRVLLASDGITGDVTTAERVKAVQTNKTQGLVDRRQSDNLLLQAFGHGTAQNSANQFLAQSKLGPDCDKTAIVLSVSEEGENTPEKTEVLPPVAAPKLPEPPKPPTFWENERQNLHRDLGAAQHAGGALLRGAGVALDAGVAAAGSAVRGARRRVNIYQEHEARFNEAQNAMLRDDLDPFNPNRRELAPPRPMGPSITDAQRQARADELERQYRARHGNASTDAPHQLVSLEPLPSEEARRHEADDDTSS